jgi:L-ascorbate metabolism protein UlaG (beta-lactamase superfamily)
MDTSSGIAPVVDSYRVEPGHLACWWLGGSGFLLKSAAGTLVAIDPYLSDSVKGIFGLARAFPPPLTPEEARPNVLIVSHWHEDHLDPGTIPVIARHSARTRFVMPPSALSRAVGWGVRRDRIQALSPGEQLTIGEVRITHVPARHEAGIPGWEVPDAMGMLVQIDGLTVYHTGDTEYDLRLRRLADQQIDAILVCINGATGNMDAHEAALLAWRLGARTAIPMHHLLWAGPPASADATLDPALFAQTYARLGGQGRVVLPEVGVPIDLQPEGASG